MEKTTLSALVSNRNRFSVKFFMLLLLFVGVSVSGWGATIFSVTGGGTLPTGWSSTNNVSEQLIDQSSYYLLEADATSDIILSTNYDLSTYTTVELNVDVATYNNGTNRPMKIEFSTNGGTSWSATTYTTATPTSSTYITGGPITITQTFTSTTKFRFTNNGTSGRGVRVKNIILTGTPTGNTVPSLTTPTSASIGTASATLGATISSNGGVTISESGIVYGTSASPTGNATPTSPSVSSNIAFTVPVSSLSPQTLYYYRGYAVNTQGTGYSADGTFRTLSNPPTSQASSLNASPTSGTALNITWSAATFPVSGATTKGYVLLRATSPNTPSLGNSNGAAPTAGANTTIVSSSITEATVSQANSGLTANTTYNYLLVPYCWDGTNATTYNYLTTSAPTCSITTPSAVSDVVAVASSESATISSIVNDAAPLTSSTGTQVWQFTVRDGGATTDADNLPTIVTGFTLTQNAGNSVDNWLDAIKTIALFDGTTWIANATSITSNTIVFSGLNISVSDNTSKTLSLRLSLNAPLNNVGSGNLDGDDFVFTLTNANFTTLTDGTSSIKTSFTAAASTNAKNVLDVTATKLVFIQQPTTGIAANIAMSPNPTVKAVDANNNTDLSYSTAVSVTSTGSLNGTPVSGTWASNVATFASLIHSASGTGLQLTASSGALTSAVSNTFDVAEGCTAYPTITTTVVPNTIGTTNASSGGQTLGVEAGCSITNKGVCWGTSTSPTIAGSKTDNGTGTTDFTSAITGLTAGTLYYVRAYATTSFGTAYGDEKTFRTLSLEPTAHPASFTSAVVSASQIDLNFSAASNITNGGGYIILQKAGSIITGVPVDGNGYSVGETIGDATVAAIINSNSTTTASITGLTGNTQYYYSIIALNWDGVNASTFNYRTSSTIKTTNKTTLKIEPTNQATAFSVGGVTTSAIPLTWTAAVAGSQAPDGYLIKLNTSTVVDPVDGTDPSNVTSITSGAANKTATGTSATSFTNMTAGTMYNYKIYSYTNSGTNINFNTTSAPSLNHATLPAVVTATSFTATGTTSANIAWTLPASYNTENHSTLVFVKATSAITAGTPTNAPSTYTANTSFGSGTVYQNDAQANCVYNGDGTSVSITGLSVGTTYHVLIYTVVDASNSNSTNSYSAAVTLSGASFTTAVSIPYSQNFEGTTNEWSFGTGTNIWTIGSATNNGGTKALYISNDGGTTNAYTLTSTQAGTDAVVRVDLTGQTAASLSFDWKSNGEIVGQTTYDYGEVYINTGSSDVLISDAKEFVNSTTFATKNISLTPYVGGEVSLKFRWVNDGSDGNQPPFAIDNISITAGDYPLLTTSATSSITVNEVNSGGNITNDGGSAITARGVCYSTSSNPTIAGDKTSDGTGTGSFVSTLSGLIDNTTYYLRAYATNSTGTAYGNEISFTTSSIVAPTANSGSNISSTGFTASWGAVTGASGYKLDVATSLGSILLTQDFETVTFPPTGWITTGFTRSTTSGDFKNGIAAASSGSSNTGTLTTNSVAYPTTLRFYLGRSSNTTAKSLKINVSTTNQSSGFSTIATYDHSNVPASSYDQYTIDLSAYSSYPTVYIQFERVSAGNSPWRLDDVEIEKQSVFVSGYNNFSVSGTSQLVTGLSPNTVYYFRVRAIGENSTSENSNTVTAFTAIDGTIDVSTLPDCPTCDLVVNDGGVVTLNASKSYHSVSVKPGGKLTLNNGSSFAPGTFVLESNASATATFVDKRTHANKTNITATVQQHLPQGHNWYVGIPIVSGSASTLTAAGLSTSVSHWNEAAGAWVNTYNGPLVPGKGYIGVSTYGANMQSNNVSFSGNLNTGDFPVTVTRTVTAATKPGFNLIANPYPSYLNPCALITGKTKLEPTIWYRTAVWSSGQSKYIYSFETVNTASGNGTNGVTGYIPPMQAFWVRVLPNANPAEDNSETLTFTNDMRYHGGTYSGKTTTTLKAPGTQVLEKVIRLRISNGVTNDEAVVYSNANALNSFDKFDSRKMSNDNVAIPEIFTVVNNEQLVINGYNQIPTDVEIPLGFKTGTAGNFTLKANEITNLDANTALIVKDKVLNLEYDLTNGDAYEFNSAIYNSTNRFSIIFKAVGVTTSIDNSKLSTCTNVFVNANGELMVKTSAPLSADAKVSVYNAVGQLISIKPLSSGTSIANAARTAGVYWVKITNDGETITRKVIVN